jgi:hypothetical protein
VKQVHTFVEKFELTLTRKQKRFLLIYLPVILTDSNIMVREFLKLLKVKYNKCMGRTYIGFISTAIITDNHLT